MVIIQLFEILRYQQSDLNQLGQPIQEWQSIKKIDGWLDMLTGEEDMSNAVLEASTHVFITTDLSVWLTRKDRIRSIEQNKTYEITFVDNPVHIGHHLEIYCKRVALSC